MAEIDVDALAVVERQHAQVIDAVRVVGVLVRVEHRVDAIDLGVEQLLAQVAAGIDDDAGRLGLPGRCGLRSAASSGGGGCFGLAGSQTPQPPPMRGTPPDDPQPMMVAMISVAAAISRALPC